jgi:PAS domain S-box-containing protein
MGSLLSGKSVDTDHERLAAVILDGMYQFVALLNPKGDILEVNRAALEGAGHRIEEIRGKPFWTARWWQVSEEIQEQLKAAIRQAASGEFVRYEVQAYGDDAGLSEITTDFSLRPIRGKSGEVEYLLPEGRNITERKQAENEVARQAEELRLLNERLKELDRLKTQFFANVSHEFRTPLTLMLGPLENALAAIDADKYPDVAENLATSHRNALRLLKLVNTMLDFSRIEAGRVRASYRPTDIAAFTADLVSNFRSACEKAGLRLTVDCAPFSGGEEVYLDRDMWEKIVLNLLSNAFKFTLEGEIEVRLAAVEGHARLTVRDTGVGIPREELPRMFERFHRVDHTRGRTHEGTGIGLALVNELVKLHGGAVTVDSEIGEGSTFTVTIPLGKAHLDPERIESATGLSSTSVAPAAYIEEALRWLPDESDTVTDTSQITARDESARAAEGWSGDELAGVKPRILWADDNADMRTYVSRLLADRYDVQAVSDGEAALEAARTHPPDLVLSDVMMPKLDGFGLLRGLRADPRLKDVPVILLSARAGEESRVEGLEAGADDYLVKPFTARELQARVGAHLKLAQARKDADERVRENEGRFRALVTATSDVIYRMSPDWKEMTQLQGKSFLADTTDASNTWLEKYIHPDDQAEVMKTIREAIQARKVFEMEHRVIRADGTLGWTLSRAVPMMDDQGNILEWFGAASDVTSKKQAQEGLRHSLAIVDSAEDAIVSKNLNGIVQTWNQGAVRMFGYTSEEMVGQPVLRLIPEELHYEEDEILRKLRAGYRIEHYDTVRMKKGGERFEVSVTISPIRDESGRIIGASKIARDISERKRIERLLIQSEKLAATGRMAAAVAHEINNPLESLINLIYLARKYSPAEGKAFTHLRTAEHELERIAHIARQTLGYYRDTGLPAELHLHELIENVLTVYKAKVIANGISVEVRFDDTKKISVSRGELLQVFSNIITNSIDAMQGGGTLNITTQNIAGPAGDGIQTVIRDSGVGIEREHLERIFEPFFTTKGDLGTGIGLWIAKQLAERRGGQISVESSTEGRGRGTSVTIFIPFAAPAPQSSTVN